MCDDKKECAGEVKEPSKCTGADEGEPKVGPIVEDEQAVGGTDKETGAEVIRPKTAEGTADKVTEATDPQERPKD